MKNLIKRLRETPSRSKRELLDKAADAIEDLTDWRDASVEVPTEDGTACNVIVNGTYGNLTFQDAVCQANWYEDEGWILEAFPKWENPNVTHWLPLPSLPKGGRS